MKQLADDISNFTTLVKEVETALLQPTTGLSTFDDSIISEALERIDKLSLTILKSLEENPLTKDLVTEVKEIINVYEDEGTKRNFRPLQLSANLLELKKFLADLLGIGTPKGKLWTDLYYRISVFEFNTDQLADDISNFTTLVKEVETALLQPTTGLSTFDDSNISEALKRIDKLSLRLNSLDENPLTKDLVTHVKEIINVYEDERTKRNLRLLQLSANLLELKHFLADLLGIGTPNGELWTDLHHRIAVFKFNTDQPADDISNFTTLVKEVETALLQPTTGLSTFDDSIISKALKRIDKLSLTILKSLDENPLTKDLVTHVKEIIKVYEDEGTKRNLRLLQLSANLLELRIS